MGADFSCCWSDSAEITKDGKLVLDISTPYEGQIVTTSFVSSNIRNITAPFPLFYQMGIDLRRTFTRLSYRFSLEYVNREIGKYFVFPLESRNDLNLLIREIKLDTTSDLISEDTVRMKVIAFYKTMSGFRQKSVVKNVVLENSTTTKTNTTIDSIITEENGTVFYGLEVVTLEFFTLDNEEQEVLYVFNESDINITFTSNATFEFSESN